MGYARRVIEARNDAIYRLQSLVKNPESVLIIHYSCESFYNRVDGTSPRINSIAVRVLSSGRTFSFSIHNIAEREQISLSDVPENYTKLEQVLLQEFYEFLNKHQEFRWVHWNMTSVNYGFPALAHRFKVLGGEPFELPDVNLINLAAYLERIYGRDYISRPKFDSLISRNGLITQEYMTGKEEGLGLEAKKYIQVSQSTIAKTYILREILNRAVDGRLKTDSSTFKFTLLGTQAFVELLYESWIIKIIIVLSAIAALIGVIWPRK
jgi:hypothetical protein